MIRTEHHGGRHGGDAELAETFSELARSLQEEHSLQDTLMAIVSAAAETIPGAQHASVSVVEGRTKVYTPAGTGELVYQADQAQYETRQGPCLDAVYHQRSVHLPDMAAEDRWPEFTTRAAELGARSMLSFQLYVEDGNLGALNLYSRDPHAFDEDSETIGLMFAAHAAVAMKGAHEKQRLYHVLHTRDLVGQAKGILMERYKISDDDAFVMLVHASVRTRAKLVDIARRLVHTGGLPTDEPGPPGPETHPSTGATSRLTTGRR